MAGQIVKRGERLWVVRIYLGRDPITGKRMYQNHTLNGTKKEAQAFLNARWFHLALVLTLSFAVNSAPEACVVPSLHAATATNREVQ